MPSITGAALTRLVVKTPAATAGFSEYMRPRSSRSLFLIPAATAEYAKPLIITDSAYKNIY
jgi:hypothetical protein